MLTNVQPPTLHGLQHQCAESSARTPQTPLTQTFTHLHREVRRHSMRKLLLGAVGAQVCQLVEAAIALQGRRIQLVEVHPLQACRQSAIKEDVRDAASRWSPCSWPRPALIWWQGHSKDLAEQGRYCKSGWLPLAHSSTCYMSSVASCKTSKA